MKNDNKSDAISHRFNKKIVKAESGCWEWSGYTDRQGYGKFTPRTGKKVLAHRMAYELFNGEIPEGMYVLHKCDNPSCVNPEHLFIGTHADNMRDMREKGRSLHGEKSPRAKLTAEQVKRIRQLHAEGRYSNIDLGYLFEVSEAEIRKIVKRERWKHL